MLILKNVLSASKCYHMSFRERERREKREKRERRERRE